MAMSKDWIRDLRAMQSGDPVAFLQAVNANWGVEGCPAVELRFPL